MMKAILGILMIGLLSSTACKSKKNMSDKDKTEESAQSGLPRVTTIQDFMFPKNNPYVTVEKASIANNVLKLDVSYSGGCEEHQFELITSGREKRSLPVQLDIYIRHDNNGDNCREVVSETLEFDLKSLNRKKGEEAILLITDGHSEPTRISYTRE